VTFEARITDQIGQDGKYRDPVSLPSNAVDPANHQPQPLEAAGKLARIRQPPI
jgi:hypothetical protein